MKGDRLYDVVDYILNEASERELEVVRSALKRRVEGAGPDTAGAMGVNPERIARRTAAGIREQLGVSVEQIRSMVTRFAVETIKKNAPELSEEQIDHLLSSWIPGSDRGAESPGTIEAHDRSRKKSPTTGRAKTKGSGRGRLSPDVILTMVTQFLAYSNESMSITEQVKLNQEIPDWQRRYWEQFSPRIRQLLSLHLRGEIDHTTCLERICADLGIDADLSS